MAHASEDLPVDDASVDLVKLGPLPGRRIGKTSMYLNHRAIVASPSFAEVVGLTPWPVEQPTFLANFKPWQLATITALATAAWAAPIGLLLVYLS